jgi:hypothetical protein
VDNTLKTPRLEYLTLFLGFDVQDRAGFTLSQRIDSKDPQAVTREWFEVSDENLIGSRTNFGGE